MAVKKSIIAGIDIGTTKVCTCLAELRNDEIRILGTGLVKLERGVSQGLIVHLMETSQAVKKSVDMATKKADIDFTEAWVGIGGYRSYGINLSGSREISARKRGISKEDVEQLCREAKNNIKIPDDYEILHNHLQYFVLDGKNQVLDPCGMSAETISARLFMVVTPSAVIDNTRNALANAEIHSISGMVLQQIASGCGVLSPDERELGVIHVNMGGGTTGLSVINRDRLIHISTLPVGSCQVTKDLAMTLRISMNEAESLKIRLGSSDLSGITPEEMVEITVIGSNKTRKVPRMTVCEVINERYSEILDAVHRELERVGIRRELYTGAVLSGGGVRLHGLESLAEKRLQMPVRTGYPGIIPELKGNLPDEMHETAAGILVYARERLSQKFFPPDQKDLGSRQKSKFEKFRDWILGENEG